MRPLVFSDGGQIRPYPAKAKTVYFCHHIDQPVLLTHDLILCLCPTVAPLFVSLPPLSTTDNRPCTTYLPKKKKKILAWIETIAQKKVVVVNKDRLWWSPTVPPWLSDV